MKARSIAALAGGIILLAAIPAMVQAQNERKPSSEEADALKTLKKRINGFIVWESNRSGKWELYRMNPDGSDFRQITQLQKQIQGHRYDDYMRPRVSPDGKTILFGCSKPEQGRVGVWVVPSNGGEARQLTVGNPLNWTPDGKGVLLVRDHLIYRYDLKSGKETQVHSARVPTDGRAGSMVGMVRADLKAAVFRTGKNEYFDFGQKKTVKTTGGCEPSFSADGRHMYWVEGPKNFRVWDIAGNKENQILGKPPTEPHNYTYFPTLSRDNRWLTYGASPNQHDHGSSDYEIFVQEMKEWKPVGKPVRLTWHGKTDRWPHLWVKP